MTELAKEYASGLYELAREEQLTDELLEQFQTVTDCFREQPDFARLLCNLSISKGERVSILDQALRGQVHPYLLNFLKILCQRGALNEYEQCLKAYRAIYNQDNGVLEATVTTSVALTNAQRDSMRQKLCAMTGKQVQLKEKLDPSVIGGVLLEMDGQRYDSTIRSRLDSIRNAMVGQAQ